MGGDELGLLSPPLGARLRAPGWGREPCGAPAHIAKGASAVDLPTMHEYREGRGSRTSLRHRQLFERRIHYRLTSLTFSMASGVMLNTSATMRCISSPVFGASGSLSCKASARKSAS